MIKNNNFTHKPVLLPEVLSYLNPTSKEVFVDATLGLGGHSKALLDKGAKVLAIEQDLLAIKIAKERLKDQAGLQILNGNFRNIDKLVDQKVDGILFDLGVSSMQLEDSERGFSFQEPGPLDMRMNPEQKLTASTIVNEFPEKALADLIYKYGEEPRSRPIARKIVAARPLRTTADLAKIFPTSTRQDINPATKTFQAIRIAVNDELGAFQEALPKALDILKPHGRIVIISFHSLEDRIVKNFFKEESQDCICPKDAPICNCQHRASLKILTKKVVKPTLPEIQTNPRARSAKLRAAEKI